VISLSNLSKAYGDRTLFAAVTLQLNAGQRYGIVGANGSGKTTLLDILSGHESHTDGELTMPSGTRIGLLVQDRYLSEQQRIIDVAMMGDRKVWQALADKERLLAAAEADGAAIAEVEERIQLSDGYSLESRAGTILEGLGIHASAHPEPLSTLSGGFKLRVLLAQTLISQPDLLLLDEPTNHLDILTIRWLEQFLAKYEGCAAIVSHDHRFLDNVATSILDVDYETVTAYKGNYTRFMADKRVLRERKEAAIQRQEKQIADQKAYIDKVRAKKTRARQAQSRLKQIEKIEIEQLALSSRRAPSFLFQQERRSGRDVLQVTDLDKAFGDNSVLNNVSFAVRRGERVAVIGANGLGKSTLLKLLVGRLDEDAGEMTWGYETRLGYFAQDHRELLGDEPVTALDYLWSTIPQETTSFVRGQLGRMLFSGDDVEKKTTSLSGGEAARLIFSRLIVHKPNVMLLDEPTNHLDLESIEALVKALQAFEGTIIFVSHDRWFVSELADRVIELQPDGYEDYPGNYDDYLSRDGTDHLDADAVIIKAQHDRATQKGDKSRSWEDQKRDRASRRKWLARREQVTADIEHAEARLAAIDELYCTQGFFEKTPKDELDALEVEHVALPSRIEQLMTEWEHIEAEIERLGLDED